MRLSFLTMSAAVLFLSTISILLGSDYVNTQSEIEELEMEQAMDSGDFERSLDGFGTLQQEIDALPDGYEVSAGIDWTRAEETAAHIYEDSSGLFKKDWGLLLDLEAQSKGIDPYIVYELLRVETGDTFDPELVGPETKYGHAYGLAQFMKNTGPWIAEKAGLTYEHDKLFDPHYAIQLSVTYLDYLHDRFDGDWDRALTAYHRGIAGMNAYVSENGGADSWYAVDIQENAEMTASAREN
ncbi:lytic transglycosylase domain-containing protein [Alkalicoccus chagannorensis]|uniref:lytic transglycosylase domain-containing protein n=1 Tax=Alkalicoccus chagannorensis TaxID=427072 RepID=UPI0004121442|nr:transglycosylase SLT domain-containing protein [Alkalicoccus chagannorensis]